GAIPPLRDIPVARPEIPHRLSASDGLSKPPAVISSQKIQYLIAEDFRDYFWLSGQQTTLNPRK
ncbi:hypothetical protein, partial [Pantoea brenneri]|uniref:hypothetical protein n=1 Tax=Pantoea brenneri TaxID=472694 RepID=UPI0028A28D03